MSANSFKVKQSLVLRAITAPPTPENGEIWQNIADSLIYVRQNGITSPLPTTSGGPAVVAKASTGAGQSIAAATFTIVDFGTVAFDSNSAITTGVNWNYTVPSTGYYWVSSEIMTNTGGSLAANTSAILGVYVNGVLSSYIARQNTFSPAANNHFNLMGGTLVSATVGDLIDLKIYLDQALTLQADGSYNHVSIFKVK